MNGIHFWKTLNYENYSMKLKESNSVLYQALTIPALKIPQSGEHVGHVFRTMQLYKIL